MIKLQLYFDQTPKRNEIRSRAAFQLQSIKLGPNYNIQEIKHATIIINIIINV
jgi:hypothetical protein